jgi:radical SAM protein, tatD family-associated
MIITYTHRDGLYVNMTNRCPNRCGFCVRSYGDTLYGNLWLDHEPSVEEIIASIDGRGLAGFSELVFCGYGEPTERLSDMLAVCRHIRSISDIKIRLNTNGQSELINGKNSTALFDGLFDIVSISLNAADADTYDKMCHSQFGKAAYPAILEFAGNVKPYVGKVILSVVDTTIPPEDIEACRKTAEKIGVALRVRDFI